MTLKDLKEYFHKQLEKDYPPAEIEEIFHLLVDKYMEIDRLKFENNQDTELNSGQVEKLENALLRLKNNEPVQYILEQIQFSGRPFKVNSHVHVPRRETETMISWVLEDYKKLKKQVRWATLLDIGTGCGLLPITLFKELPQLKVWAMDISEEALNVARENADLNNAKIDFLQADVLQMESLPHKFDIVVSNPPYVLEVGKKDVQRKILDFEPALALYVKDNDPMLFNRKIAELAKTGLTENGAVYVEINQYLTSESAGVFQENGFKTELRKDVFGNIRTLKAFR
ncbi:MAG TPA: peptide chain release factor N(5)-glutamine methyltransferase [Salinimicrobium sp.]|nr:peptide chain release factor N(5)-glutamine methyltransferase [Salinimicrobium sp.]